ncbi:hypothetical protein BT96DRAFT_1002576 [Gymnopus androsaceus JB14]|uniref:Uncharacterized protein n=1 Tax=Gymnopus androsaceus JB14 TaxID=1447944 RepID=A0A6A4GXI2_9AGAR|nr:hypothetical protein BT96DRAFT_1002576 [Gymnopus androsaceus JB14]
MSHCPTREVAWPFGRSLRSPSLELSSTCHSAKYHLFEPHDKLSSETLEDIADMEIVEREFAGLYCANHDSFLPSELILDHEEKVEKNATSYSVAHDLLAPVASQLKRITFFVAPAANFIPPPNEELTRYSALDAERQYHRAAITELEEKHKEQMVAYAAEFAELLKVQATLEDDLTRTS